MWPREKFTNYIAMLYFRNQFISLRTLTEQDPLLSEKKFFHLVYNTDILKRERERRKIHKKGKNAQKDAEKEKGSAMKYNIPIPASKPLTFKKKENIHTIKIF